MTPLTSLLKYLQETYPTDTIAHTLVHQALYENYPPKEKKWCEDCKQLSEICVETFNDEGHQRHRCVKCKREI